MTVFAIWMAPLPRAAGRNREDARRDRPQGDGLRSAATPPTVTWTVAEVARRQLPGDLHVELRRERGKERSGNPVEGNAGSAERSEQLSAASERRERIARPVVQVGPDYGGNGAGSKRIGSGGEAALLTVPLLLTEGGAPPAAIRRCGIDVIEELRAIAIGGIGGGVEHHCARGGIRAVPRKIEGHSASLPVVPLRVPARVWLMYRVPLAGGRSWGETVGSDGERPACCPPGSGR